MTAGRCRVCGRVIVWGDLATPREIARDVCPDERAGGCVEAAAEIEHAREEHKR